MHHIFETLPSVQGKIQEIEDIIMRHQPGVPVQYLEGCDGMLTVMHAVTRTYQIEWYAVFEDADEDAGIPATATARAALASPELGNRIELTWDPVTRTWRSSVDLPEADGLVGFHRQFRDVFDRADRSCSEDESFEIINAAAAFVAKG